MAFRVSLAVRAEGSEYASHMGVLWSRVEGSAQVNALKRFAPRPTLVIRDGELQRATAVWALLEPVRADVGLQLNRRIAHRLGATKKHGDPDASRVVPPGGRVRDGVLAGCNYVGDGVYDWRLFERLPAPPKARDWRAERQAA